MELNEVNKNHIIELSYRTSQTTDQVLNTIVKSHYLLSNMSFKDRHRLKRLILKYEAINES
jgi:hypothetical protein